MEVNTLGLNRLRHFYFVYRQRGIRKAAKLLHVTPAATSISIKTLEEELGFQLFSRVGHDLVPTRSAAALYEVVARFFLDLHETLNRVERDAQSVQGTVRVGAPNGFGAQILVPLARAFQSQQPNVAMVLRFGTPERLVPLLVADEIDMAVAPRFSEDPGAAVSTTELPFAYEPQLVCSRELFDRSLRRRRSDEVVVRLDHVSLWNGTERILSWYRHHFGRRPNITVVAEVDSIFAAVAAVREGSCVALLPSDIIAEHVRAGEFVVLFPHLREKQTRYVLARLKDRLPYLVETEFARFLLRS